MEEYYEFDCGCKFKILDSKVNKDGFPSMEYDFYNLRNCNKVWDLLETGNTKGVFQLESQLGQTWCEKFKPKSIDEIAILTSIIRPGSLEAEFDNKTVAQHFVDRKQGLEECTPMHPALGNILEETYNLSCFQEQSIQIARDIAGFDEGLGETLRKCLTKDTVFITATGPRTIKELYKGESKKVLSLDPVTGKNIFLPLKSVSYSGKKRVMRIRTEMGETICGTYDHRVYTDKGWKEIQNITKDDHVLINQRANIKGSRYFSNELMKLFGYFISEGCSSSGGVKITNSDEYVLSDITSSLDKLGEKYYIRKYKNGVKDVYITGSLRKFFLELFGRSKSRNKIIPNKILSSDKEGLKRFIGSYFSGDGYVSSKNLIGISSTSKEIILTLQAILITFGLNFSFRKKNSIYKGNIYHSYEITSANFLTVSRFRKLFGDNICLEKREKLFNITDKQPTSQCYHIPSSIIKKVSKNNQICDLEQKLVCGAIYNQNMSYDKADYINSMIQSDLLSFFINCDARFSKVRSVTSEGKQEVYDFEIDSNNHFAYANNILVHNSIGKKLVEKMAELKPKFIQGCVDNGLTEKDGEDIFSIIQSSERYSFNRSHSTIYSYLTYATAYIKVHFPALFFTSWLHDSKEKIDPTEERRDLIADAKRFNIQICSPTLEFISEGLGSEFFNTRDKVYFGLVDIKGIGYSEIKKLETEIKLAEKLLNKNVMKFTWFEFLCLVASKLKKTVVNNLILVGSTPGIESRKRMLLEYKVWEKLNDKETTWIINNYANYNSLSNSLKEYIKVDKKDDGPYNSASVKKLNGLIDTIEKVSYNTNDDPAWVSANEVHLMGVSLSSHVLDDYDISGDTTCKEMYDGKDSGTICAQITAVRETVTKNGKNPGQKMCFVKFEDQTDSIDGVCFPNVFLKDQDIIYIGSVVVASVKKGQGKGVIVNSLSKA